MANTKLQKQLVRAVVIDQMRWDYLHRCYDRYQQNGFKRMLNEGFTLREHHDKLYTRYSF